MTIPLLTAPLRPTHPCSTSSPTAGARAPSRPTTRSTRRGWPARSRPPAGRRPRTTSSPGASSSPAAAPRRTTASTRRCSGFNQVWAGNAAVLIIAVAETADADGKPLALRRVRPRPGRRPPLGAGAPRRPPRAPDGRLRPRRACARRSTSMPASSPSPSIALGPIGDAPICPRRCRSARPHRASAGRSPTR